MLLGRFLFARLKRVEKITTQTKNIVTSLAICKCSVYFKTEAKNGAALEKLAPVSFVKVLIMLSKKTDKATFNYSAADQGLITRYTLVYRWLHDI